MEKESPILFSTPMVQAILEGRKTMTRRTSGLKAVNKFPKEWHYQRYGGMAIGPHTEVKHQFFDSTGTGYWDGIRCPYGKPGDILWVRETWTKACVWDGDGEMPPLKYWYRADKDWTKIDWHDEEKDGPVSSPKWKPSIHMPKAAARIWLEVTEVRVERLHEIKGRDAVAEGFNEPRPSGARHMTSARIDHEAYLERANKWFTSLWHTINGEESWNQNPWVWVVSFKVLSTTRKSNSTPNPETGVARDDAQRTEP